MLSDRKLLKLAIRDLSRATWGGTRTQQKAHAICSALDPSTIPWFEWQISSKETLLNTLQKTDRALDKKHGSAIRAMHTVAVEQFLTKCRDSFDSPGSGELQRFLQRTAPRPHMWGILPRDKLRRYRSLMRMGRMAEQAWIRWMGPDFVQALQQVPLTPEWSYYSQGDLTLRCRQIESGLEVAMRPLTDITTFLLTLNAAEGSDIHFMPEDSELPYTSATNKLSQLEFYYAWEGTSSY